MGNSDSGFGGGGVVEGGRKGGEIGRGLKGHSSLRVSRAGEIRRKKSGTDLTCKGRKRKKKERKPEGDQPGESKRPSHLLFPRLRPRTVRSIDHSLSHWLRSDVPPLSCYLPYTFIQLNTD